VTLTYDLGAQITAPAFREIFGNANANGLGGSMNTWTTTTVRAAGDIRQRGATSTSHLADRPHQLHHKRHRERHL